MPTFHTKHTNLRITRRSHLEVQVPGLGSYRTVETPIRYQFQSRGDRLGVLEVEHGEDLMADGAPIRDPESNAVTGFELQDAVGYLRSLPEYNSPELIGGFTEVGREPDRIPDAGPRVREIIAAMAQLDREALVAFAEEEEAASYEREPVTAALEEAFSHVDAALEALGTEEGGQAPVTAGNGAGVPVSDDDLEQVESMAGLKAIGGPLGLTFPPGTSKVQARDLIREARAAAVPA